MELLVNAKDAEVEIKDEMSGLDIKKAVVMKLFPKADFADKDDVYINARFDAAVEILKDKKEKEDTAKDKDKVFTEHKKDGETDTGIISYKERRDKYIEELENGHKDYSGSASVGGK